MDIPFSVAHSSFLEGSLMTKNMASVLLGSGRDKRSSLFLPTCQWQKSFIIHIPGSEISSFCPIGLPQQQKTERHFLDKDWVCQIMSLWSNESVNSLVCWIMSFFNYKFVWSWVCQIISLLNHEFVESWVCRIMSLLNNEFVKLWVCQIMSLSNNEFIK
jgi:hypothetical protein